MVGKSKVPADKMPVAKIEISRSLQEAVASKASTTTVSDSPRLRNKSPARIKSPMKSKSPTRTRSPARLKSPAAGRTALNRSKSPGRAKSPARRNLISVSPPLVRKSARSRERVAYGNDRISVSPAVVSPKARAPIGGGSGVKTTVTTTIQENDYFREKIYQPKIVMDLDSDSDNVASPLEVREKPKATVRGRTRKSEVTESFGNNREEDVYNLSLFTRRFTRSSHSREIEQQQHIDHIIKPLDTNSIGEFSDEDDVIKVRQSISVDRLSSSSSRKSEFGGVFGALFFILSSPLIMIGLYMGCNETQCSFQQRPNLTKFKFFATYFHAESFLYYIAYVLYLAIFSALPFGGRKVNALPNKQGKLVYVTNAMFACITILASAIGLELSGFDFTNFIIDHCFHLLIAAIIVGILLSIHLYIRSFYVNLTALSLNTRGANPICNYFLGREINPRIFGLVDVKMYLLRLSLVGSILYDFVYLYRSLGVSSSSSEAISLDTLLDYKSLNYHPTLIALVIMHSIYFFDAFVHESSWVTSFEIQYEGCGYMGAVGYSIYPFMVVATTKYVADYNINLDLWHLIVTSVVFLFGFALYRLSNEQKSAFRLNPYSPALSHLETIPTTQGRSLLASGYWGMVRHPNYLGDILMNLCFAQFVLFVPPVLTHLSIVLLLIHRSSRDNARCKQKYGLAWDRYCNKVKYVLVPKIY